MFSFQILVFVLTYDIDVFDDCKSVQFYKCTSDNRVLYQKVGPNQYQPIPKDPRMMTLTYIYQGIPTKFKNGLYSIPHQDIQPTFLSFGLYSGSNTQKEIATIQSYSIILDFTNNTLKVGNFVSKFEFTNYTDLLKIQFEVFNYDFDLIYKLNVSAYTPLWTNVKFNKEQLVYLSQTALIRDITITSITVDVLLEIIQILLVYVWNALKHKYLSKQIANEINVSNKTKKEQIQQEIDEYKKFKDGLKEEMERQIQSITRDEVLVNGCKQPTKFSPKNSNQISPFINHSTINNIESQKSSQKSIGMHVVKIQ